MPEGDKLLLRALRREPLDRPPVWLMRQAGRYLPEYKSVRADAGGFLEMVRNPEMSAEVTLQPIRRFNMDAAIVFSDILLPLEAMGLPLLFDERGPVLPEPLRSAADVAALEVVDPRVSLAHVGETLQLVKAGLPAETALIGFCGAPFTLASYAIEGGTSRTFMALRHMMYHEEGAFRTLLDKLTDMVAEHLRFQIEAGAEVVMLFDTWAASLTREDYERFAGPWTRRVLEKLAASSTNGPDQAAAPCLVFAGAADHLLEAQIALGDAGAAGVAVDHRTDLLRAFELAGGRVALQGNLDPGVLLATPEEVTRRTRALLKQVAGQPGHILGLGHGVQQFTQPECVAAFVAAARELD